MLRSDRKCTGGLVGDDAIDSPVDQPCHDGRVVDRPGVNLAAGRMCVVEQGVRHETGSDAQHRHVEPGDVSDGCRDDRASAKPRVVAVRGLHGLAVERGYEAISLKLTGADQVGDSCGPALRGQISSA